MILNFAAAAAGCLAMREHRHANAKAEEEESKAASSPPPPLLLLCRLQLRGGREGVIIPDIPSCLNPLLPNPLPPSLFIFLPVLSSSSFTAIGACKNNFKAGRVDGSFGCFTWYLSLYPQPKVSLEGLCLSPSFLRTSNHLWPPFPPSFLPFRHSEIPPGFFSARRRRGRGRRGGR